MRCEWELVWQTGAPMRRISGKIFGADYARLSAWRISLQACLPKSIMHSTAMPSHRNTAARAQRGNVLQANRYAVFAAFILGPAAVPAATAQAPLEEALAAAFRITDGKSSATAFLVAADSRNGAGQPRTVLLTAAHNLEGMKENECTLVFRARQPSGEYVRKEVKIRIRAGEKPQWKRHPSLDIAALAVDLPEGTAVKPLRIRELADEKWVADGGLRVGQDVYIACFPARLESNPAGWAILRKGSVASYPLTPAKSAQTLIVDFSTFGGDSGAPVIARDGKTPMIVGMILGMYRQTDKVSLPFEERTVHMPLGLAIAVQASFLRETVDLLGK